jgi:hypothetical protein
MCSFLRSMNFQKRHRWRCSLDGACTNQAEEYFSRLRRAEIGTHIAGAYLLRYAQEATLQQMW